MKNNNLLLIQTELKVPKGNFNAFGKYKYRSAENILEAVKPILKKYNSNLILSDEILLIGAKFFCKSIAKFTSDNEAIETFGFAEIGEHKGMSVEQSVGTASSYARKYALNGLFLVDETEADADSINSGNEQKQEVKQQVKQEVKKNQVVNRVSSTPILYDILVETLKLAKTEQDIEKFGKDVKEQISRLTSDEIDNLKHLYQIKKSEIENAKRQ